MTRLAVPKTYKLYIGGTHEAELLVDGVDACLLRIARLAELL